MTSFTMVSFTGRCGAPPDVAHATHSEPPSNAEDEDASWGEGAVTGRLYRLGTELLYSCLTGYYMDGYYKATCMGEGHWIGPTMRCLRQYSQQLRFTFC